MEAVLQCPAPNYAPLSPVSFLKRAAGVYGERASLIYGTQAFTWSQTYDRCLKLASALVQHFLISPGDLVAAFAPNIPELYELHFAVPMAGAVISPLNTKLDAATLALLLQQLQPKIIFADSQFLQVVLRSLDHLASQNGKSTTTTETPFIVLIPPANCNDDVQTCKPETPASFLDYNGLLAMGRADFTPRTNAESDPISVNCTSGSTGLHKGVVYSHRATYLNSLATIFRSQICRTPVFLWTVDMFRCNGWCFIWAVAALGGCNICLRNLTAKAIFDALLLHEVTLLCGAPAILKMISEASDSIRKPLPRRVDLIVAGAFPLPEILTKVTELGFNISYGYGMTEALGPAIIRPLKPNFESSSPYQNRKIKYYSEGFQDLMITLEVDVKDLKNSTASVPEDGETLGEIMFRGNTLMSGYLKNPKATREAFMGDWYRTGDLAVRHPGGFIQMKDRAVDIIVRSGGETVSTVEVEGVLVSHPKVAEAAVVGKYEVGSGDQTPCGFVKLKNGCSASSKEIIEFCEHHLPGFMVPKRIVFGDLPVNSTGKVQKFVLREKTKAMNTNP